MNCFVVCGERTDGGWLNVESTAVNKAAIEKGIPQGVALWSAAAGWTMDRLGSSRQWEGAKQGQGKQTCALQRRAADCGWQLERRLPLHSSLK